MLKWWIMAAVVMLVAARPAQVWADAGDPTPAEIQIFTLENEPIATMNDGPPPTAIVVVPVDDVDFPTAIQQMHEREVASRRPAVPRPYDENAPRVPKDRTEYIAHAVFLAALWKGDIPLNASAQRNGLPFMSRGAADAFFLMGDGGIDLVAGQAMRSFGGSPTAREAGTMGMRAVLNAGVNVQLLKTLFGRANPIIPNTQVPDEFTGPRLLPGHDSFPSGHTASAFAFATVMAHYYPRKKFVIYTLAGLSGISTIARHVHWWSDVYAGALVGNASGIQALRRTPNFLMIKF